MKAFVLTPLAVRDTEEIWEYLAADSRKAALRVLDHLEACIHRLARNPGIGHLREDLADRRHRFFPVGSYLIVYRHQTKPLQVIRILHAARDVRGLLGLAPNNPQDR
jgi:plasmid stabilization system protein ParE